ncbi:MAG: hypothetical protein QY330_02090 [Candidatus Dojkabacteria bacterium]|uniref:Uncharacterized protein n=2 Tax=Candidatus Dojkabacteria TaxID=74243 RepID=A0A136KJJ7_9BACT|nr:MAG: hypothetical protein UZ20_WS6002000415 [candidate division WS6 bacterium OLB21]MBW7953232.1 hypothetical protein [Candidatus Dojkabacteria bacterium]WKZ28377.1 MAG: hypothetical protein QY330_02090 [Candidatus Dojkabacteria bacterium]
MLIKSEKNNLILRGANVSVAIVGTSSKTKKFDQDIVLSGKQVESAEDSLLITHPGEYEAKGVFIYALDTNESTEANMFSVNLEQIQIVYLDANTKKIDPKVAEQVGIDHILVVDFYDEKDYQQRLEMISIFDPYIFLPLGANEELSKKIAAELGVELPQKESKFKFVESDFADEEHSTSLYLLSD